jgi:subtilisin family serine protease
MKKLKNIHIIIIILSFFTNLSSFFLVPVFAEENNIITSQTETNKPPYVEGEVIVKYKDNKINLNSFSGITKSSILTESKSLENIDNIEENNISVLSITDGSTVEEKITELESDPNIEYAQPNYQYYPSLINTNDTYKTNMWGLDNTGQTITVVVDAGWGTWTNTYTGTVDADMDAPEAWAINEGTNSSIIVAIIDTGVAYLHPDLMNQMWDGTNCKNENGTFLGGCNYGYDYENMDKTPIPTSSYHGTHVAGIVASEKNNAKGLIGIAPRAKIMALKTSLTSDNIIKNINFAKHNGAHIINASWGGAYYDQAMKDVIASFPGLFVTAAGNCGDSNYAANNCGSLNETRYPGSYDLDNIISVASTDSLDALSSFSNNSPTAVDVGAPGSYVYSTITLTGDGSDEKYEFMNGTSMASPYVAGLAALIKGYSPNLTVAQTKSIILGTGDTLASLSGKTLTSKRINAQKALQNIKSIINFTIPGQDGATIIDESNHTININTPFGVNISSVAPNITIAGASVSPNTSVAQNFTSLVTYTVTGLDNTTQNYIVTITPGVDPDVQSVSSDKASLTDASIKNTNTDLSNVTSPLSVLPTSGSNGSTISWLSSNPSVLSNDGQTVNRPGYGGSNVSLTLTATLTKGSANDTKVFNIIVLAMPDPDIALIALDKDNLTSSLIKNENTDLLHITSRLSVLPVSGSNGSTISWVSSNPSVLSNDGQTVNRPAYRQSNVGLTLTATLTKGIVSDTKSFSIIILAETVDPDVQSVSSDKASLTDASIKNTNTDLSNITSRLSVLPVSGSNGSTISWVSSNPSVLSNDGQTVNRPAYGSSNVSLTLTATITKGSASDTKVFNIIVLANTLESISITHSANKLSYYVGESIDIGGLIVTGLYSGGSTRTEAITSENITGFNSSTPVTNQIITITIGGKTTTFTINIVIRRSSGGGGGGGGSSSGSSSPKVVQPVVVVNPNTDTPLLKPINTIPTLIKDSGISKITKTLKQGLNKDNDVKLIQAYLNIYLKLNLTVDGSFGPKTKQAVVAFQKLNKLIPDGIIGKMTRSLMK